MPNIYMISHLNLAGQIVYMRIFATRDEAVADAAFVICDLVNRSQWRKMGSGSTRCLERDFSDHNGARYTQRIQRHTIRNGIDLVQDGWHLEGNR